jgi:hypothetical protein
MITLAQLTGAHRRTYQKIFHQPISTDVKRTAVRSLLETLGQVAESGGHKLEITRNGHVLELLSLGAKKIESTNELLALRHFLKRSEAPQHDSNGREAHLLLVIGHHEARLFRSEIYGGVPEQILPPESKNGRTIANSACIRESDTHTLFDLVAQALRATGKILIFGESSATQPEMDRFIGWLKRAHPDLAERIIGSMVLDQDEVSSSLLLAKAREFYTHTRPL